MRSDGVRGGSAVLLARSHWMRRVALGVLVGFGLLAACGWVVSTTGARARRAVCGPSMARTLAGDRSGRVYVSADTVYGCAAGSTRSYLFGSAGACSLSQRNSVGLARVVGRLAAYSHEFCGIDFGVTVVKVRRLTDGKFVRVRSVTTRGGVEGFQSVGSLVLKRDGAVAWIATGRSIGPPTFVRQLARLDRRGFSVLDSGRALAVRSLTLRRSTISWRHGKTIRTAKLH